MFRHDRPKRWTISIFGACRAMIDAPARDCRRSSAGARTPCAGAANGPANARLEAITAKRGTIVPILVLHCAPVHRSAAALRCRSGGSHCASGVVTSGSGRHGALSAIIASADRCFGGPQWVGWLAGIGAATAISLGYGRMIAPRLAYSDPIVRAVATLGLALVILGFMDLFWGEYGRVLRLPTDALGVRILDVRVTYTRLIALGLSLALTAATIVFLARTRTGLAMRALANRREISALGADHEGRSGPGGCRCDRGCERHSSQILRG